MILKRKIYSRLLEWKTESKGSKAILIEGARRIGKSTICEEFARNEYNNYILIDFAKKDKDVEQYFESYLNDLDTFFMMLQAHFGKRLKKRDAVIIFDEVQMYPQARAAIKYLVADGRYDYIETGSLISIKENVKDIVIPSEERHLNMYPLDFEEFAWALGEDMLLECIRSCFIKRIPMDRSLHNKAMLLFKQYMLVEGRCSLQGLTSRAPLRGCPPHHLLAPTPGREVSMDGNQAGPTWWLRMATQCSSSCWEGPWAISCTAQDTCVCRAAGHGSASQTTNGLAPGTDAMS